MRPETQDATEDDNENDNSVDGTDHVTNFDAGAELCVSREASDPDVVAPEAVDKTFYVLVREIRMKIAAGLAFVRAHFVPPEILQVCDANLPLADHVRIIAKRQLPADHENSSDDPLEQPDIITLDINGPLQVEVQVLQFGDVDTFMESISLGCTKKTISETGEQVGTSLKERLCEARFASGRDRDAAWRAVVYLLPSFSEMTAVPHLPGTTVALPAENAIARNDNEIQEFREFYAELLRSGMEKALLLLLFERRDLFVSREMFNTVIDANTHSYRCQSNVLLVAIRRCSVKVCLAILHHDLFDVHIGINAWSDTSGSVLIQVLRSESPQARDEFFFALLAKKDPVSGDSVILPEVLNGVTKEGVSALSKTLESKSDACCLALLRHPNFRAKESLIASGKGPHLMSVVVTAAQLATEEVVMEMLGCDELPASGLNFVSCRLRPPQRNVLMSAVKRNANLRKMRSSTSTNVIKAPDSKSYDDRTRICLAILRHPLFDSKRILNYCPPDESLDLWDRPVRLEEQLLAEAFKSRVPDTVALEILRHEHLLGETLIGRTAKNTIFVALTYASDNVVFEFLKHPKLDLERSLNATSLLDAKAPWTILMVAFRYASEPVCLELLSETAPYRSLFTAENINLFPSDTLWHPFRMACGFASTPCVLSFLSHPLLTSETLCDCHHDKYGDSALVTALMYSSEEVCLAILNHEKFNAGISEHEQFNSSSAYSKDHCLNHLNTLCTAPPFYYALRYSTEAVCLAILDHPGFDSDSLYRLPYYHVEETNNRASVLHAAFQSASDRVCEELIKKLPSRGQSTDSNSEDDAHPVNDVNGDGQSVLLYGFRFVAPSVCLQLLRHPSLKRAEHVNRVFAGDAGDEISDPRTILMVACRYSAEDVCLDILPDVSKDNLKLADIDGWTALVYAAQFSTATVCRKILEKQIAFAKSDDDGTTGQLNETRTSNHMAFTPTVVTKILDLCLRRGDPSMEEFAVELLQQMAEHILKTRSSKVAISSSKRENPQMDTVEGGAREVIPAKSEKFRCNICCPEHGCSEDRANVPSDHFGCDRPFLVCHHCKRIDFSTATVQSENHVQKGEHSNGKKRVAVDNKKSSHGISEIRIAKRCRHPYTSKTAPRGRLCDWSVCEECLAQRPLSDYLPKFSKLMDVLRSRIDRVSVAESGESISNVSGSQVLDFLGFPQDVVATILGDKEGSANGE